MATVAEVQAAYRAIARTDLSAATAQGVVDAGTPIDTYIANLLAQNAPTTGAAVAVASFLQGMVPTSARLDSLTAFANTQAASYAALGQNARIGAYEAIGRGIAADPTSSAAFSAKYGALSTADFVNQAYAEVFGITPSAGAAANLTGQVTYFTALYVNAGIAATTANLLAKGATVGQIIGYAVTDPAAALVGSLDDKVNAVLTAAAKGDMTVYNKALPNTPNSGAAGVTIQLTAGADVVSPTAANASFKTTSGNDTITGLAAAGLLANGDSIDGGGGSDTLIGKLLGNVSTDPALAPANKVALSNVEILRIDGNSNTFDATGLTGVTSITATGAVKFTNLPAGLALAVENAAGLVRFGFGTATAAASANIELTGVNANLTVGDAAIGGQLGATALTLTVQTNGTSTLFLDDTVSLAIKGAGNTNFTLSGANNTKLTSISASEATGSIALTQFGHANDTAIALSGQDDIYRSDFSTQKLVTISGGAGSDRIAATGLANADFNADNSLKAGAVLNDFTKGADKVDLTALGANAVNLSVGTLAAINAATSVKAAVSAALNDVAMAANKFTSFTFGGDTYIVREDATNGVTIGDGLIKIVGVSGLTIGAGAASDILTA